jgi:hypothetical protein
VLIALYCFAVQGLIGAFDTFYYHEWRARLPGGGPATASELTLHGARDLLYAVLFGSLPFVRYEGAFTGLLAGLVLTEIALTLRDFVVEDTVRRPLGGVFAGERITHAVMGLIYGAALANLAPVLLEAASRPTALVAWEAPHGLRLLLAAMAIGVFLSGVRDLAAAHGPRWCRFPWANDRSYARGAGGG